MLIKRKHGWELGENRATPESTYLNRRQLVQAIGLGAALDYMRGVGRDRIRAHEDSLGKYAHERLARLNSIRIFGHAPDKGAIVARRDVRSRCDQVWRRGSCV